ncbi:glutamine amidotransferase [Pseudomonas sp. BJa5]|uniref:glutamine amidotransferase n=1 Tax=Pseudomonas sp. BJa5 TaxID=2936270 RepID=UPI002559BA37|nr:glutamine amidotransferase [Pseudomonas sp. BGr12]MDL2424239.1 glutamine amidotransferase [Pseudomonas sp. BGr12]
MKTLLVLRHIHFEDLGYLEPVLVELGYSIHYLDVCTMSFAAIDEQKADLVVILGGPIGAYEEVSYPFLTEELELIRRRLKSGRPLLGICLGAQLIARALGAKVYPMPGKEIGFGKLSLTASGQESVLARLNDVPVLHWHGDQFDIPEQAQRLAETDLCGNQAFSLGNNLLALQFHLEADSGRIEQWLVGHAAELAAQGIDPTDLRLQASQMGDQLEQACRRVIEDWVKQLN